MQGMEIEIGRAITGAMPGILIFIVLCFNG
jgi:hypothetical protein